MIAIYFFAIRSAKKKAIKESDNCVERARRAEKQWAEAHFNFKMKHWDEYKNRAVVFITKNYQKEYANIWEAADALGLSPITIYMRAYTKEKIYVSYIKGAWEPVQHRFYWVN
jgi:hypothetical protein